MSAYGNDFPKTTRKEVVLATLGGLFAPALVFFLIAKLVMGIQATHLDDPVKAPEPTEAAAPASEAEPQATVEEQPAEEAPAAEEEKAPEPEATVEPDAPKAATAPVAEPVKPAPVAKVKVEPVVPVAAPVESVAKSEEAAKPEVAEVKSAGKSGEDVFKAVCSMCHAVGLMGAPKIGDKEAWGPRIAQGHDTLVEHALKGVRMMPAKGGNPSLSDSEVAAAVTYMANQGGANFK